MTFADLGAGEAIFLDANPFVYPRVLQSRIEVLTIPAPMVAVGTGLGRFADALRFVAGVRLQQA